MWRWTPRVLVTACFLLMVCFVAPNALTQPSGRSYALVVGINKYLSPQWPALMYAVKDAEGLTTFLKQQGFDVTTLYNQQATKETIIYQLQNVLAPRLKPGDRVLVFFAGHGYTERFGGADYGYIVPHDGKGKDYSATYISMEELLTLSRKMGAATHQLFIMDACYGGLLGLRGGALDEKRPDYIPEVSRRKARQILTAGGADQQVVDNGPEGHSVFTGYLLKALSEGLADRNGDGYITFSELVAYMTDAATNAYQTPGGATLPGHELGEFLFRSPSSAGLPRTSSPPPSQQPQPRSGQPSINALASPSPSIQQQEIKGIIARLQECKISEKQATCYVEFKSSDSSEKKIGLWTSRSIMYDNKSVSHKASSVFLVDDEKSNDEIKKRIPPGGVAEGRVTFKDVTWDTEKISELIVHTVIHSGHGVWGQHQFKFQNINLSKQQDSKGR